MTSMTSMTSMNCQRRPFVMIVVLTAAGIGAGCTAEKKQPAKSAAAPVAAQTAQPKPAPPASVPAAEAAPAAAAPVVDLAARIATAADSNARVQVIDEIGAIGQNALPALGALVAAFEDADPRVRWHAARAVGLIGEDARSAMPAIMKLLDDADPIVVTQAAAALGSIREDDSRAVIPEADAAAYAAAVEPLAKAAIHADPRARRAAVRALGRYRSPADIAPMLSRQLADADPAVVVSAVRSLAGMGDLAVPMLLEALKDPKSRYWAEVALADMGPEAAAAVEPLEALAGAGEAEERLQAILSLAAVGEKASSAADTIAKVLGSPEDAALHLPAAFALGRIRSPAGDDALRTFAAGDEPFMSSVAAWALARIHPDDAALREAALGRLRGALTHSDAEARASAANGISDLVGAIPEAGRAEVAAELLAALTDGDERVGRAAGAALIRLGGAAVPALQSKLGDPAIRLNVMEILSQIGAAAKPALPELTAALADADPQVRGDAAVAIAAIGEAAVDAVPGLQKIVVDAQADPGLRSAAAFALGKIGPAAGAAGAALRDLAGSDDEMLASVGVWAALKIKPDDAALFETAIPKLRRALRGDREMVRLEAAVSLGDIGPAAAAAIPLLELVAEDDPVRAVRQAAAEAVGKIRGR
ncbi:MAG: HEAT repeat domain-containing protein [Planctomycetaceae bacterium]